MQKALQILKAAMLAAVAAACVALTSFIAQAIRIVQDTRQHEAEIVNRVDGILDQAKIPLQLSGKLINDGRLTLDNLNKAAIDERFYFEKEMPGLVDQAHAVLGNVQQATADLHPLIETATARVQDLAPIEANAAVLVSDVDATAKDPHIAASLKNLDTSSQQLVVLSKQGTAIGASVQAIAADGQAEVHSLTHPKPLVSIVNWTMKGTLFLRHLIWP